MMETCNILINSLVKFILFVSNFSLTWNICLKCTQIKDDLYLIEPYFTHNFMAELNILVVF